MINELRLAWIKKNGQCAKNKGRAQARLGNMILELVEELEYKNKAIRDFEWKISR